MYCIGSEQFFIESSRSSHIVWVLKVKAFGGVVLVSVVDNTSDLWGMDLRIYHLMQEIFLCDYCFFC